MANFGFLDARTDAELLLAPHTPVKRIALDTSSLKLDLGGLTSVPGAISGPGQITGAIRGAFTQATVAKSVTSAFATALNTTYAGFQASGALPAVDPMFLQTTGVSVDIPGVTAAAQSAGVDITAQLPGTAQFVQFSTLRPGQAPSLAQAAMTRDRMSQVQGLASRFSSTGNAPIGSGVQIMENMSRQTYPHTSDIDIPSFSRFATGGVVAQQDAILKDKRKFVARGVRVGSGKPGFWSRLKTAAQALVAPNISSVVGQAFRDSFNAGSWSEPAPPYNAQYPYNKAQHTESGHLFELDDTPGAERVHIFHRSGSFVEFHPNGTVVYKNMKDSYSITMADQNVKVSGKCNIYVGGDTTLYSKGSIDIETDGEFNVHCKDDFNVFAKNVNLRAKQTFKADGLLINLRYINLPYQIIPTWGALVPMVNLAAYRMDFPTGTFDQVVQESIKGPLDEGILPPLLKFQSDAEAAAGASEPVTPPSNPLSNPAVYTIKTAAAAAYRARLFDTPEETENFEMYSAHLGLQQTLGDIPTGTDPRALGGKLTNVVTEASQTEPPLLQYLDYTEFAGKFVYTSDYRLGNTSFTLADLVDTEHANDVVTPKKTPLDAAVELGRDGGQAGPLTANDTPITVQGVLGSGGVSGGLPTQASGVSYEVPGRTIPEIGLSPWPI